MTQTKDYKVQLAYSVHHVPEVGERLRIEELHPYPSFCFEIGSEGCLVDNITKVVQLHENVYEVYSGDTIYIVQVL